MYSLVMNELPANKQAQKHFALIATTIVPRLVKSCRAAPASLLVSVAMIWVI
jgi:hypothetical protein